MMGNQALSFTHLYHQALVNPKDITASDFEQLLARYPYSQPLHFAFERRRFLEESPSETTGSRAVLLASSANWLYEYVRLPLEEVPVIEVENDDYVPYEDVVTPVEETVIPEDHPADDETTDTDTLETLVQEGIGGGDYFAVHAKETSTEEEDTPPEEDTLSATEEEKREEDISLYNDELMPYSFRWWLHKTRLEHADTYQPFASPQLPVANKRSFDASELDRVVLDQQIREHIIHLQNPEDKLSDDVKQRSTDTDVPHKTADVIERFIREEPQIQPPQPENLTVENKARKSSEEQFNLVTETLANIYAEQGMYVKAIEVYKKLILRFPEKKSYFAPRIKELEEKLY